MRQVFVAWQQPRLCSVDHTALTASYAYHVVCMGMPVSLSFHSIVVLHDLYLALLTQLCKVSSHGMFTGYRPGGVLLYRGRVGTRLSLS